MCASCSGEMLGDVPVHDRDIVQAVKPAGDARLVGDDGDRQAARLKLAIASAAPSMKSTLSIEPT